MLDGRRAKLVGLLIGRSNFLACVVAFARMNFEISHIHAYSLESHFLCAFYILFGDIFLHLWKRMVQAGLEEYHVVFFRVERKVVDVAISFPAVHLVVSDFAVGIVYEPVRMFCKEPVAGIGPACAVDIGDRPDSDRSQHLVLFLDKCLAAIPHVRPAFAACERILCRCKIGDVSRRPGKEFKKFQTGTVPAPEIYGFLAFLERGGTDIEDRMHVAYILPPVV